MLAVFFFLCREKVVFLQTERGNTDAKHIGHNNPTGWFLAIRKKPIWYHTFGCIWLCGTRRADRRQWRGCMLWRATPFVAYSWHAAMWARRTVKTPSRCSKGARQYEPRTPCPDKKGGAICTIKTWLLVVFWDSDNYPCWIILAGIFLSLVSDKRNPIISK